MSEAFFDCLYCGKRAVFAGGLLCEDCLRVASPPDYGRKEAYHPYLGARERCPRAPEESTESGQNMAPVHRAETLLPCLKCGSTQGWSGPRHEGLVTMILGAGEQPGLSDWLEYTCLVCGWERREPTKDKPAPAEPGVLYVGTPGTVRTIPAGHDAWKGTPCVHCGRGPIGHVTHDHVYTPAAPAPPTQDRDYGVWTGHTWPSWSVASWYVLSIVCALGWYLFLVQTIARMYPE